MGRRRQQSGQRGRCGAAAVVGLRCGCSAAAAGAKAADALHAAEPSVASSLFCPHRTSHALCAVRCGAVRCGTVLRRDMLSGPVTCCAVLCPALVTCHVFHDEIHALLVLAAAVHAHHQRVVQQPQDVALASQVGDLQGGRGWEEGAGGRECGRQYIPARQLVCSRRTDGCVGRMLLRRSCSSSLPSHSRPPAHLLVLHDVRL